MGTKYIGLAMGHFLLVVLWTQVDPSLSSTVSQMFHPQHPGLIDTMLNRHGDIT